MSYININEVDKTIQDLSPITSDNIVYIPLNSTDGPAGVYTVMQSYSDFVRIYGQDPEAGSPIMTSWDYAANLLLRNMPVMVRRIVNFIDDEGNDLPVKLNDTEKSGPLPGVTYAECLLKVKDIDNLNTEAAQPVEAKSELTKVGSWGKDSSYKGMFPKDADEYKELFGNLVYDPLRDSPNWADEGNTIRGEFLLDVTPNNQTSSQQLSVSAVGKDKSITFNSAATVTEDEAKAFANLSDAGVIEFVPSESSGTLYITQLKIVNARQTIYDAKLSSISKAETAADLPKSSNLQFVDSKTGEIKSKSAITIEMINVWRESQPLKDNSEASQTGTYISVPAIVLPAGVKIRYNDSSLNMFSGNTASSVRSEMLLGLALKPTDGAVAASLVLNKDAKSSYALAIEDVDTEDKVEATITYQIQKSDENETVENAGAFDQNGNINVFKVRYRNPGENGARLKVAFKTLINDGIYLQVWNGTQRLENIQLVNLRYKTATSRFYNTYTIEADAEAIWALFLKNFGVNYPINPSLGPVRISPLITNYLTVELNEALDFNEYRYINAIYNSDGNSLFKLEGGSSPASVDVIHEVNKTYSPLKDKYLYDVKFITNGSFVDDIIYPDEIGKPPRSEFRYIEDSQIDLAESRGDALAFVDVPLELPREDALDYFSRMSTSYATAYAPWIQLSLLTRETKWCPPSFAALWTIAKSVGKGNEVYAPPAGVNRANIPECQQLYYQIPSDYIDTWNDNHVQFINPIVYINGYGVNIFGQKTLYSRVDGSYDQKSALQFLNTRLVANEIKKKIFKSCIELTFEYNNLHTWLAFKTKMSSLLDTLYYNHAITYYDIRMDESTMTDADIQSNHIVGIVSVAVSTTAEKFDITFELLPNQVNYLDIDYSVDNVTQSTN